ncbi:hypothetical protein CAP48_10695 [Advenella sp. S44]|nr:hypothetical protein CAP48_10695 [Advenella sp. S44]
MSQTLHSAGGALAGNIAKGAPDRANYAINMLTGRACRCAGGQNQKGEQNGAGKFHNFSGNKNAG